MHRKTIIILFMLLLLTACMQSAPQAEPNAPVAFVTSTLPPTKLGLVLPTQVPPTATATLSPTDPTPTPSCHDGALFVEDVNYPDNTQLSAGEKFTKTWKFKNTGTCKWIDYKVAFVSGDRLDSPDAVPVPETEAAAEVEVSIDLTAPSSDGAYTGNFELRNDKGKVIPLGSEPTFWVKILVGDVTAGQNVGNCPYTENADYVKTLIDLINQARADVNRPALTVNAQLTSAARSHSLDMACNNFFRHSGSDGSWTGDRLTVAGYTKPYYLELLGFGLAQDAMNQWHEDNDQWGSVINSRVTEIGVGYVFSKFSLLGGYWTVVMGGE
jgi:uncharacterized protein YkwD